ncbi:MAG: tetratricopeptide repeat protein, partial [Pyrinomonadaceae bacterium]
IFGEAQKNHLRLLREYRLIPFETLAAVDYSSLSQMSAGEKNLFYAQSWSLVHFLMQKNDGFMNSAIKKYLALIAENKSPENAFEQAFNTKHSEIETRLAAYISKKSLDSNQVDFGEKLNFETQMKTELIGEAVWLNYLGDLLLQSQRYDAAAELLKKSLALNENSAMANLSFGKVLMKQGKAAEAVFYFEKAIACDGENYAAKFYLADGLFRENLSADGYVNELPPERAKKIRELLKTVISQNPQLIEAYKMLALISLTNNDEVSESLEYLQNALKIQPQNFRLAYNLAQLFLRRKDFEMARKTALGLSKTCGEKDFCERVREFINALGAIEQKEKELAELRKKLGLENVDFEAENLLPPEEAMNRALNRSLRKPQTGEKRFVGNLTEIVCGETVTFKIEGENQLLKLSKPSFDGIFLISYSRNTAGMRIECGKPKIEMFVVAAYKTDAAKQSDSDGELFVLEFVPKEFKLIE